MLRFEPSMFFLKGTVRQEKTSYIIRKSLVYHLTQEFHQPMYIRKHTGREEVSQV